MASENVGSIYYDAKIETKDFKKNAADVEKAAKGVADTSEKAAERGTEAWKKFSDNAVKAAKVFGAASAAAFGAAVKSVANLEQSLGGSEVVFGKFSDKLQAEAQKSFKVMGTSMNQYLETANKMGSLFQGAGFTVEKSMDLTMNAMQRATDVATAMGISTEMALESIAGAAKGNFTMMDNLGVAMNDTTLEAYRLEKGLGKAVTKMTSAEKVGLAMQLFMERTAKYAGNYAKENETLAGSFQTLKASFTNLLAGIEGSDKAFADAIIQMSKVLGRQLPVIAKNLAQGLNGLLTELLSNIDIDFNALRFLEKYQDILKPLAVGIGSVVIALKAWKIATGAVLVAQGALNALMLANPYARAAYALMGLASGLAYFFSQTETGIKIFNSLKDSVIGFWNGISGIYDILFKGDFKGGIFGLEEDAPFINFLFNAREGLIKLGEKASEVFTAIGQFLSDNQKAIENTGIVIGSLLLPKIAQIGIAYGVSAAQATASFVAIAADSLVYAGIVTANWIGSATASLYSWVTSGGPGIIKIFGLIALESIKQAALTSAAWVASAVKTAAAWVLAMGPIGLLIAALVGAAALIINNWEKVGPVFDKVWDGIKNGAKSAINWVIRQLNGLFKGINGISGALNGIPGVNIGKIAEIPQLANGGIVKATPGGMLANIGEGGEDEAVIPLSKLDKMLDNGGNGNKTEITIGQISIADRQTADYFIRRLSGDQEITSAGLVPNVKYMGA